MDPLLNRQNLTKGELKDWVLLAPLLGLAVNLTKGELKDESIDYVYTVNLALRISRREN